jgi:hypothetical protein
MRARNSASSVLPVGKLVGVGGRHGLALERQAFAAAGDDLQRTLRVAAVGLLDVQSLLGLGHRHALLIDRLQRSSVPVLGQRQAFLPRFEKRNRPCSTRSSGDTSRPCQCSSSLASGPA